MVGNGIVVVVDACVVVELGRVVVVEAGLRVVVEVVDDELVGTESAPFKIPSGSLAPVAGLPPRVGAAHVGHSTRFCFVWSMYD